MFEPEFLPVLCLYNEFIYPTILTKKHPCLWYLVRQFLKNKSSRLDTMTIKKLLFMFVIFLYFSNFRRALLFPARTH